VLILSRDYRLQILAFTDLHWDLVVFSINHLDLHEVQRRQFLNLRVTWGLGCSSDAINTTRVNEESGNSPEQKQMQEVSSFDNLRCTERMEVTLWGIKLQSIFQVL
jgi:hypothetical protein